MVGGATVAGAGVGAAVLHPAIYRSIAARTSTGKAVSGSTSRSSFLDEGDLSGRRDLPVVMNPVHFEA
jgi:hypothetical protein